MARSKQATPLRRETSSEYFSKHTPSNGTTKVPARNADAGDTGDMVPGIAASLVVERKDAGIVQLLIAVGGIYASL